MAKKFVVRNKIEDRLEIQTNDYHTCIFACDRLFHYLNHFSSFFKIEILEWLDTKALCNEVNRVLYQKIANSKSDSYKSKKSEVEKILQSIQQQYEDLQKQYEWVKTNEKACIWLWSKLQDDLIIFSDIKYSNYTRNIYGKISKIESYPLLSTHLNQHEDFVKKGILCLKKNLPINPSSHNNRLETIEKILFYYGFIYTNKKIMDLVSDLKPANLMPIMLDVTYQFPTEFIDNCKSLWEKLYLKNDMLNWLKPSNEKQCFWVWNYLWEHKDPIGYHNNEIEKKYFTISSLLNLFNPINNKETYLSICAIIYYLLEDESKNNSDLLKRMKKSWLQKLRRTKKPKPKKKVELSELP